MHCAIILDKPNHSKCITVAPQCYVTVVVGAVLYRTNRYIVYILFICVYILFRLFSVYVLCRENEKKGSKNKQKGEHGKKVVTAVAYIP